MKKCFNLLMVTVILFCMLLTSCGIAKDDAIVESQGPVSGTAPLYQSVSAPKPDEATLSRTQPEEVSPPVRNNSEDWMLILVNADNPLPDNHSPKLKSLTNGLKFDERAIDQLNAMLAEAKEWGLSPVVCSAYRTIEYQRTLFSNQVSKLVAKGLNREQAEKEARKSIAYPGTSEHNLGLAVDIVALDYQLLDEKQADTSTNKWLTQHCAEYGFILRYPKGKEEITGVKYEPWHFRYVGVQAAMEIMETGLCLEEYLSSQAF